MWDPEQRITAEAALTHPYLSLYHDPTDEPIADETFDWSSIDVDHGLETWKTLVYVLHPKFRFKFNRQPRYFEILDHFGGASAT